MTVDRANMGHASAVAASTCEDWIDSYRWPIDWPLNFLSDLARHGSRGSVCTAEREGYTVHDRFTPHCSNHSLTSKKGAKGTITAMNKCVVELRAVLPGRFFGKIFQLTPLSFAFDFGLRGDYLFVSVDPRARAFI